MKGNVETPAHISRMPRSTSDNPVKPRPVNVPPPLIGFKCRAAPGDHGWDARDHRCGVGDHGPDGFGHCRPGARGDHGPAGFGHRRPGARRDQGCIVGWFLVRGCARPAPWRGAATPSIRPPPSGRSAMRRCNGSPRDATMMLATAGPFSPDRIASAGLRRSESTALLGPACRASRGAPRLRCSGQQRESNTMGFHAMWQADRVG